MNIKMKYYHQAEKRTEGREQKKGPGEMGQTLMRGNGAGKAEMRWKRINLGSLCNKKGIGKKKYGALQLRLSFTTKSTLFWGY